MIAGFETVCTYSACWLWHCAAWYVNNCISLSPFSQHTFVPSWRGNLALEFSVDYMCRKHFHFVVYPGFGRFVRTIAWHVEDSFVYSATLLTMDMKFLYYRDERAPQWLESRLTSMYSTTSKVFAEHFFYTKNNQNPPCVNVYIFLSTNFNNII